MTINTQIDRDFYQLGRAHCARDKVIMDRPAHWTANQHGQYWNGVYDENSDRNPDLHTLLAW